MKQKLDQLGKENLRQIILKMGEFLSREQYGQLERMVDEYISKDTEPEKAQIPTRMSQEYVNEKMSRIEDWMKQINDGELCLNAEGYEDYSTGYWNSEWVTEYYDNQGIGDKILSMIQFAKDCVDDRRYQEANDIYEWLWEMCICCDKEFEDPVDLEKLIEEGIVRTDMKQLVLLTLYADYQVQEPDNRAQDIYLYFSMYPFWQIHIEEMFHAGRENLTGIEQFWKDWIALLKTKSGAVEARLLQEAVLYNEGIEGLVKMADENCKTHPSLYLTVMKEYDRSHDYKRIEEIGEKALGQIDSRLVIRSQMALKAAYTSSCLKHEEKVMLFCWEAFRSESTDRNFLRLFGTKEMAERYGIRGKEVLSAHIKGNPQDYVRNEELRQNVISDHGYYTLSFYTGDFEKVKEVSKNPKGSLGWSGSFIRYGIRLILLYLYQKPLPSKAAAAIASYVGFGGDGDVSEVLDFESEIIEENRKNKTSMFWNYFQRWKKYFPMEEKEQKAYFAWAEKIVHGRADAIVGNQHRNHYSEVAVLLAIVAEIKENMGMQGAKAEIFAEYKRKFPRHSSFQAEMKSYFGMI